MNYGRALEYLQTGCFLTRTGWNGKGQFVYMVPGHTFSQELARGPVRIIADSLPEGQNITYRDHIDIRAVDGSLGVWFASMSDTLASDWEVIDEKDLAEFISGVDAITLMKRRT